MTPSKWEDFKERGNRETSEMMEVKGNLAQRLG